MVGFGDHFTQDPYEGGGLGLPVVTPALVSGDASSGFSPFDTSPFGHAALDDQSAYERAFAPLPDVTGQLNQDPDFTLPTAAGPLRFQLFYYSSQATLFAGANDVWGVGRRASWPLRLCAQVSQPSGSPGPITTVILERENGSVVRYLNESNGQGFVPITPRCFDNLVKNPDGSWDETRLGSGTRFHYPAYPATQTTGGVVTLSYFETVFNQRVTMSYDGQGRLSYIEEPAGRRLTYQYDQGFVREVVDWAGRIYTFSYETPLMKALQYPTGERVTFSFGVNGLVTLINDPEGESVGFQYEPTYPSRVITRTRFTPVLGGQYTATHTYAYITSYTADTHAVIYTDPYGQVWTTTYDSDNNVRTVADPKGAVRTASYDSRGLPLVLEDALGRRTTMTYNGQGQMLTRKDPLDHIESWTYDSFANVLTYIDQMGRQTSYDYGGTPSARRVMSETNALSKTTQYTYNSWGALETVRTPLGNVTTYNWGNLGVLDSEVNPLGKRTTYAYDAAGNRKGVQNPLTHWTTYTYDAMDRVVSIQNAVGSLWQTIYDGVGRMRVQIDPLGKRTTYNYLGEGDAGRQVSMTDARGVLFYTQHDLKGREIGKWNDLPQRTTILWDIADRPTTQIDEMGRATETVFDLARQARVVIEPGGYRTSYGYDAAGRVVTVMNARGYVTTNAYDPVGRLTGVQDATGRWTTMAYDELGRHTGTQNALGHWTSMVYDDDNRKIADVIPGIPGVGGATYRTTYGYDKAGQLVTLTNARAFVWTNTYDDGGRLRTTQQPSGAVTTYEYDAADRQIGVQNALGHRFSTMYDPANRVSATWDPLNHRTSYQYNPIDLQIEVRNARGFRTTTLYDIPGRPYEMKDANNARTTIGYNAANQPVTLTNAKGGVYTNLFDVRGLVTLTVDAMGNRSSFTLDEAGNIKTRIDAENQVTTYGLDPLNRITSQVYPDGSRFTFTFDPAGQMETMQDPTGATSYSYYSNGWLESVRYPDGVALTYLYDEAGNRTQMEDSLNGPSNVHIYTYDGSNRLIQLRNPFYETSFFEFDALDRIVSETYANGLRVSHVYDQAGRKTTLQYKDGSGTVLAYYTATYDEVNNLKTVHELSGDRVTYTYDNTDQILTEKRSGANAFDLTYTYGEASKTARTVKVDAAGNRTTYAYNNAIQLTSIRPPSGSNLTFTYDKKGNLLTVRQGTSRTTYTWDYENRLVSMHLPDGTRQTMTYDAMGLKRSDNTAANGLVSLVWDGENAVLELGPSSQQTWRTEQPGVWGGPVSVRPPSGQSLFYGFDLQANTRQMVDSAGAVQTSLVYTAFGEIAGSLGPAESHAFGGQFGYQAEMNGLSYVRARHYDPSTARWISADPIGFEAGDVNLYRYVGNCAATCIDPSGTDRVEALEAIRKHRNLIISTARDQGIQPELLAGVIWVEVYAGGVTYWNSINQWISIEKFAYLGQSTLGMVGMTKNAQKVFRSGEIKVDPKLETRGASIWAREYTNNLPRQFKEAAQLLKRLAERPNRYPGNKTLTPWQMSIILTEYNIGDKPSKAEDARPSERYGRVFLKDFETIRAILQKPAKTPYRHRPSISKEEVRKALEPYLKLREEMLREERRHK